MYMLKGIKGEQSGVASLITVLFVSIILSIIVLGFVRVAINEQRQSTDNDLSTRAFYAAESGIEDAKRAVLRELADVSDTFDLNEDNCAPPAGFSGVISQTFEFDVEYTCMLIDMTPPDYQTFLEEGETALIKLEPASGNFNRLRIYWHLNETPANGGDGLGGVTAFHRAASDTDLPQITAWNSPAMMRAYLFSHPDGTITRAGLNNSGTLMFLNPVGPSGSNPDPNNSVAPGSVAANHNANSQQNEGLVEAECNQSWTPAGENTDYLCFADIQMNNVNNFTHYIRLTSLYKASHIKLIMYTGTPINSLDFKAGQQVLVDVTGRAADVYRRVEARLDLDKGLDDVIPDYAIFSADDLCKNFGVTATQFTPTTCP